MKTEELKDALDKLTEIERQILIDNINYHTVLILLNMFPDNDIIKDLANRKRT